MKRVLASSSVRTSLFVMAGAAAFALSTASSCALIPDPDRVTEIVQPDIASYVQHVDPFLARRCGTLDCHGQPGRAYRIYSREGLRLSGDEEAGAGLVSGQQPTTVDEIRANFSSAVGLEPEQMSRVVASPDSDPNTLLLLRKPLLLERHKGGPALAQDDSGYKCIVGWLRVPTIKEDGTVIPPEQRSLPQRIQDACAEAASIP